jgi:hypothetical protein
MYRINRTEERRDPLKRWKPEMTILVPTVREEIIKVNNSAGRI